MATYRADADVQHGRRKRQRRPTAAAFCLAALQVRTCVGFNHPSLPVSKLPSSNGGAAALKPRALTQRVRLQATVIPAPRQSPQFSEGSSIEQAIEAATDRDWKRASLLFHTCVTASKRPPQVRDCNRFLRVLGDSGRLQDAVQAYEAMVKAGLMPTIVTFSTLISRAGAAGKTALAQRFFTEMLERRIKPDAPAFNSLINAFAKVGAVEKAMGVFELMRPIGVHPTIITFNSLLDACARAGDAENAATVFEMVKEWGLQPNERTYSILIHSHAKGGQVDDAFAVLQQMRATGITPNTCTYSTLINGCSQAGQLSRAFETLREMTDMGLEPNVVTWTTLIHACSKNHQLEMGFSLFREMMVRGVSPNGVTCSALMDGCLKHGEVDLAFQVLEYMLGAGLQPTRVTYTSLLSECARLGRADRAAQVLKRMRKAAPTQPLKQPSGGSDSAATSGQDQAARKDGELDVWLGGDLVQLFGKARRVDEALTHLPINEVTYGVLLGACGRVNKLMRAFILIKEMRDTGVPPTEATYLQLLELCRQQRHGQAAVDVFEAMRSSGVQPGVKSYTSLLQAISDDNSRRSKAIKREAAMWAAAEGKGGREAQLQDADDALPQPTSSAFDESFGSEVLDLDGHEGQTPEPAAEDTWARPSQMTHSDPAADNLFRVFLVFGEMKSQGVQPDRPAYNALINSCAAVGDLERAMAVLRQMYEDEHCLPPDAITFTSLIKTAAAAHNADAAEEIFAAMQQRTNHFSTFHRPSERTFRHMITANMNIKRFSRVQELWAQMLAEGLAPSSRTCSLVLGACRHQGDLTQALSVYGVMNTAGIRPDNRSLLSLVRLCESAGMADKARDIIRDRSSLEHKNSSI
ncbi:hypothetical protein JKP88DRAFT_268779 [Tribonema minus]|uniref:PROP1-like PPR domain-containing protein n=1 Tax=Tribonema minus TaxID=303371 RepID=A0A836CEM1_9STRA|nr:hypothetical protein JKP88DRAFT_268779 [Tribonema minus]